jgi:hypothetical protein
MSKLDELIRDALEGEDRVAFDETEELGWFALSLSQFTGKLGWVTWVMMVVQTVMFILGAWCAIRFFQATEVLPAVKWGLSGTVLWIMGINLKLSLMPQMQADRVIRQLRRVELLLVSRNGDN